MGVKQVAYEAFLKVEALEELLVAKGIIAAGEPELRKQEIIKQKSERHAALLIEFWNRISEGDLIYFTNYGCEGTVLAKSDTAFHALTVSIVDKGISKYKKGHEYTFQPISPEDIRVSHPKYGSSECPPRWG